MVELVTVDIFHLRAIKEILKYWLPHDMNYSIYSLYLDVGDDDEYLEATKVAIWNIIHNKKVKYKIVEAITECNRSTLHRWVKEVNKKRNEERIMFQMW